MRKWGWFLSIMMLTQVFPAYADNSDQMASLLESMKQQMAQMQQTIDQQNTRLQQLEASRASETARPSLSVPSAPAATMSDDDFQKSLKDNIGKAIPWMQGAKFAGDFRLRYEAFDYFKKNNDAGSTGTTADRTRNRFRIRLRWGFEKDYGDDWKVGFRLATGNTTDPNSTNQTLGNSGYFNFKTINIDRAYGIYEPNGLKDYGLLKGVKVGAGKFDNPFLRYSTTIVWDPDVTPEGIYEQANLGLLSTEENTVKLQFTSGQFIVNENAAVDNDANLYAYQGAINWSTYNWGGGDRPVDIHAAVSYYDYTNWFNTVKAAGNTASTSYLRTNSIVADSFRVLDIYPEVTFYVKNTPLMLWYDYAVNTANVGTDDVDQSLGNDIHDTDTAWGLGFKLGKAKKKGAWEAFYGYYEIGANAVVAAFNDSDFGGPGTNGFTNRKGHKFGASYLLTDNISLNWTGYVVKPLNPFNGNATIGLQNATNESVFRSQLDLVYKF